MKEITIQQNSGFLKICSICNQSILDMNLNCIQNIAQKQKLKRIFKYIQPSELIKKCNCKNIKKGIDNEDDAYVHKYCILLNVIYQFEIKCQKCNTAYNLKINKRVNLKKKFYLYMIFLLIYIIHLSIYILSILLLFFDMFFKKNAIYKKYNHLPYFLIIILLLINSFFLYFSIINNINFYKYIYDYTINIFRITNFKITKKYYELLYDYYRWFYNESIKTLLIEKYDNYIINKEINISNKELKIYIKNNNKEYKIKKTKQNSIIEKKNTDNISKNNKTENNNNSSNCFSSQNYSKYDKNNPIDNIRLYKKKESTIKGSKNNLIDDLYSDKTDNSKEENNEERKIDSKNNNDLNIKRNLIDATSIHPFKKDYINININPIQANNINININFNNEIKNNITNNENKEISSIPRKLFLSSSGKTALIPNKNYMNKLIKENINKNNINKRRQIKSIKLRQKDIKIEDTKITGNIEENEEIDFSEFEKGKMESGISKDNKLYFLKNIGSANDIFKTKKSYKDVPLNISNPTDSAAMDEMSNNRFSLKNNIVNKNKNFSNSNLLELKK